MRPLAAAAILAVLSLQGCGLNVASPDLFLLTRTGQGKPLTLLVNDGGTVRCDGGSARALSDPLLLSARQVASDLDKDAKAKLRISAAPNSVFTYTVRLQDGTITFPDTAAARRPELARAEQLALQIQQADC